MDHEKIIEKTARHVRGLMSGDCSGHDFWHVWRVHKTAVYIAKQENVRNRFVVELAALLHDVADAKLNRGDKAIGPRMAVQWLEQCNVDRKSISHVAGIIRHISFTSVREPGNMDTLEGRIVQDADRLDAIGAVGIARAFAYGGFTGNPICLPEAGSGVLDEHQAAGGEDNSTLSHFYQKLLHLKELMNTRTAREMALGRHRFMAGFLDRFYREWNG